MSNEYLEEGGETAEEVKEDGEVEGEEVEEWGGGGVRPEERKGGGEWEVGEGRRGHSRRIKDKGVVRISEDAMSLQSFTFCHVMSILTIPLWYSSRHFTSRHVLTILTFRALWYLSRHVYAYHSTCMPFGICHII